MYNASAVHFQLPRARDVADTSCEYHSHRSHSHWIKGFLIIMPMSRNSWTYPCCEVVFFFFYQLYLTLALLPMVQPNHCELRNCCDCRLLMPVRDAKLLALFRCLKWDWSSNIDCVERFLLWVYCECGVALWLTQSSAVQARTHHFRDLL